MKRINCTLPVLFLFSFTSIAAHSSAPPVPIQINDAAVHEDPRLAKPVTIASPSIPLKEVLDKISDQTGAKLTIDANDPTSSYRVCVFCDKVPASSIMNALYSAFSINQCEWAWRRSGTRDNFEYSLFDTPAAENDKEATYNQIVSGILNRYIDLMRQLTALNPEDREKHKEEIRKALLLDGTDSLTEWFAGPYKDWIWDQAAFFFHALSISQQDDVLAGKPVTVALKSLDPEIYNSYHQCFLFANAATVDGAGNKTPEPEPTSVGFYRDDPRTRDGLLGPTIMATVNASGASGSWIGTGHFQTGVPSAIKRAWILPGDSLDDSVARTLVSASKETDNYRRATDESEAMIGLRRGTLPQIVVDRMRQSRELNIRLEQIGNGSSVPLVAVIPSDDKFSFSDPTGQPLRVFLDKLEGGIKHHMYKWRNGVLIISYPGYFVNPLDAVPYSLLSTITPDRDGVAPLSQWAKLMASVTESQSNWLLKLCKYRYEPVHFRNLMLLLNNYPEILNADGHLLDADARIYVKEISGLPGLDSVSGNWIKLRLRVGSFRGLDVNDMMTLEWQSEESGKWRGICGAGIPLYLPTGTATAQVR